MRAAPRRGGSGADGEEFAGCGGDRPAADYAQSPRLGPRRSERESKTRALAVSPGQFVPLGLTGARKTVCGRVGARSSEEGRRVAKRRVGGTGTGRSERTTGVTEERRPPRGAPLGNKLQDHSSERRKKSPCCFPSGCGRPACANPAFAPGEPGGRRPAPPPPPPPRLGVSLL